MAIQDLRREIGSVQCAATLTGRDAKSATCVSHRNPELQMRKEMGPEAVLMRDRTRTSESNTIAQMRNLMTWDAARRGERRLGGGIWTSMGIGGPKDQTPPPIAGGAGHETEIAEGETMIAAAPIEGTGGGTKSQPKPTDCTLLHTVLSNPNSLDLASHL